MEHDGKVYSEWTRNLVMKERQVDFVLLIKAVVSDIAILNFFSGKLLTYT